MIGVPFGSVSVAMVQPAQQSEWGSLLSAWHALDVPSGYRAEISEGTIRMTPQPAGPHSRVAAKLHRLVVIHDVPGLEIFQSAAVEIDELEKLYQPDLVVLPESSLRFDGTVEPVDVATAVEITSPSTARFDREEKRWAYARAGIPSYLLVDRVRSSGPVVVLHTQPKDGQYQSVVQVPYGEKLTLPPPFDVELDTSEFPVDPS